MVNSTPNWQIRLQSKMDNNLLSERQNPDPYDQQVIADINKTAENSFKLKLTYPRIR
jgi:hypothetical protein